MLAPFIIFVVLIFLCAEELGAMGVAIAVAAWLLLLIGSIIAPVSPLWFVVAQVGLDIALILTIFGGDIKIS